MTIRSFPEALKLASTATTPAEFKVVLDEIVERLHNSGHAISIDSAASILEAMTKSFERVHMGQG